jgi:signal transduction histidine kinase
MPEREHPLVPAGNSAAAPDVVHSLEAVAAVARAAVGTDDLPTLAGRALGEMRASLALDVTAMYVVGAPADGTYLRLAMTPSDGSVRARDVLTLDPDAARLVGTGRPLIFRETATWFTDNPFQPPAADWLVLPLDVAGALGGVVVGAASRSISLEPLAALTLRSLGDVLSAAVATARLRQEVLRAGLERERLRIAEELHDGLAQDLALALREAHLLRTTRDEGRRVASVARLEEALLSANRIVRSGLEDLTVTLPVGGLHAAVRAELERARVRGTRVDLHEDDSESMPVNPTAAAVVLRVLHEALSNCARHAPQAAVTVSLRSDDRGVELHVADDGPGMPPGQRPRVGEGHFGLVIMAERARRVGGTLIVEGGAGGGGGTTVRLKIPMDATGAV